jgi:ferredoxin
MARAAGIMYAQIIKAFVPLALYFVGMLLFLGFGAFAWSSSREKEPRATAFALALTFLGPLPFILVALLAPAWLKLLILALVAACGAAGLVAFLLPIGRPRSLPDTPTLRFDERDIVFARMHLQPGSADARAYYRTHPEKQRLDEKLHRLPGLLSTNAPKANPWAFASAEASFSLTEALREHVTAPPAKRRITLPPPAMTRTIKALTRFYGANSVGVAALHDYHVYSHIGRGTGVYGAPIALPHRFAIAFTVEMDHEMLGPAPDPPGVMETAKQYVEAAKIALQLSYFIQHLGFDARAHIDGNYRLIAPLVARDAGLGEIGRMGLLITPHLGPRIRLGVVTTTLELVPDGRMDGTAIQDFCSICHKCAENCPVRAIPLDERREIEGAYRWRIDSEACFRYWNTVGTDCGRCVAVCPFSHPDTSLHNMVRWGMARSGIARRGALWMDNLFYGRRPSARPAPPWVPGR